MGRQPGISLTTRVLLILQNAVAGLSASVQAPFRQTKLTHFQPRTSSVFFKLIVRPFKPAKHLPSSTTQIHLGLVNLLQNLVKNVISLERKPGKLEESFWTLQDMWDRKFASLLGRDYDPAWKTDFSFDELFQQNGTRGGPSLPSNGSPTTQPTALPTLTCL